MTEQRKYEIMQSVQGLMHAQMCYNPNCGLPSCPKMTIVIRHTKMCGRMHDQCRICKQVTMLYCYHAKYCRDPKCSVPKCDMLKEQMAKNKLHGHVLSTQGAAPAAPALPVVEPVSPPEEVKRERLLVFRFT